MGSYLAREVETLGNLEKIYMRGGKGGATRGESGHEYVARVLDRKTNMQEPTVRDNYGYTHCMEEDSPCEDSLNLKGKPPNDEYVDMLSDQDNGVIDVSPSNAFGRGDECMVMH